MSPKHLTFNLLAICLLLPQFGGAAAANERLNLAAASISADELQQHVDVLADDQFEGREAGTRGGAAAGVYIMKELARLKLQPAGEAGGYFQDFASGRNILAVMPGSDPELRKQYIIVGGHYDHVGYGTRSNSYGPFGYVHNGADDNASGVAGILEVAQAFRQLDVAPKRSVLFAFWDGEEKGLLGSQHFVRNPTVPFERIDFAFNVDMIGQLRNDQLEVFGVRSTTGLRRLVSQQNTDDGLMLKYSWDIKANSDHHSFFAYGIPMMMFHTGLHDRYHRPSDDAETVNKTGMERVSRLMFRAAWALADRDEALKFRQAARLENESHREAFEAESKPPAVRLGLGWRRKQNGEIEVIHVEGPAAAAGIEIGDRMVTFQGRKPPTDAQLRMQILYANQPVQMSIQSADGKARDLTIPLQGSPVRIGFSWRADEADPSLAVISLVRRGSAAEMSGVQAGDRIVGLQGRTFRGTEDLLKTLSSQPAPISLLLENKGRVRRIELNPLPPRTPHTESVASTPSKPMDELGIDE